MDEKRSEQTPDSQITRTGSETGPTSIEELPDKSRLAMIVVPVVLILLIGGVVLLLATAPPSPEPDPVVPDEFITVERSRFFLWGQRVVEIKNPAQDIVFAYFINHEPDESFTAKAERCARTELARFTTATCYAFGSEEAVEFGGLPPEGGDPEVGCWVAAATGMRDPSGEITVESRDNPQIDPSCPA